MATESEAQWSNVISSSNHGALVRITAWLMLIAGLMFLGIRLTIRIPWKKLLGSDDYVTIAATVLGTLHTAAILQAVKFGLGRHVKDVIANEGQSSLSKMSKAIYIGELFFVLSITCSKLCVSLLFVRLASGRKHILPAWILSGFILAWGLASLIGVATTSPFLSDLTKHEHTPWPRWWAAIAAIQVALELALFLYPWYLVWDLQMNLKSKATVLIGFALRLPTSVIACVRLVALIDASYAATDISWSYVKSSIYTEVEIHYSLIAATIPCMHLFFRHFSTGYLSTTADQYIADGSSRSGGKNDSYAMYSSSMSAGKQTAGKEDFNATAAEFDFGEDFPKPDRISHKITPGLHLHGSGERDPGCPKAREPDSGCAKARENAIVTDGGWEMRPSGCGGTSTTKIVHSQHASDGSVTSDGSDRIIIKKTVDVHYES